MALLHILKLAAAKEGIQIDDANQKALIIARINEAARELWESTDFAEALEEEVFDLNVSSQVVALPWYVEYLRGWRYFENRITGETAAKKNRYQDGYGNEVWTFRWRHVKFHPLQRSIENESVLKLSIPQVETVAFTVNIIGATPNASRVQETLTFNVGDTEKTSAGNFKEQFVAIVKDKAIQYDLTVKDVNGNILAVVPNHRTESKYHLVQVLDYDNYTFGVTNSSVEVLFKRKYSDMVNDYDEFLYGDKYDKAIFWKYLEHKCADAEAARAYQTKCQEVLAEIAANEMAETKHNIAFTANPYFNMPYVQKHSRVWNLRYPVW
jgi:hypothetical protein